MKTAFILFFVGIFLTMTVFSFAGGKCKYDYNKKDAFTGKQICYNNFTLFKKNIQFGNPKGLFRYYLKIGKNGNEYFIEIDIYIVGIVRTIVENTDTTFIKLENDKIIKLVPKGEFKPVAKVDGLLDCSNYVISFNIDNSDFSKLCESKVSIIKSMVGPNENIGSVKESSATDILEIVNCLKLEN